MSKERLFEISLEDIDEVLAEQRDFVVPFVINLDGDDVYVEVYSDAIDLAHEFVEKYDGKWFCKKALDELIKQLPEGLPEPEYTGKIGEELFADEREEERIDDIPDVIIDFSHPDFIYESINLVKKFAMRHKGGIQDFAAAEIIPWMNGALLPPE